MGIQQSREESEGTLRLLRSVTPQMFASAKEKLVDLTRNKCKMYVTKWELLLILQMNARDVKSISQFITGEEDPVSIDANTLYLLLVLTNKNLKPENKIEMILAFICFESVVTEADINILAKSTIDEIKYVFQLAYMLLNRITDLDLLNRPFIADAQDQNNFYGSQAERDLIVEMFGEGAQAKEIIDQKTVLAKLQKNEDVQKFMMIFQSGKVEVMKKQPRKKLEVSTANQNSKFEVTDVDRTVEDIKTGDTPSKAKGDKELSSPSKFKASKKDVLGGSPSKNNAIHEDESQPKLSERVAIRINDSQGSTSAMGSRNDRDGAQLSPRIKGKIPDMSLNQRSPHTLVKMSKKILELRNENDEGVGIFEQTETIQKLESNICHVLNKNQEMYSQKQLLPSMLSHFASKMARDTPPGGGSNLLAAIGELSAKSLTQTNDYNEVQFPSPELQAQSLQISTIKKTLRNTFEEYLMEQRVFLKYELASLHPQLMHFYIEDGSRGTKRYLEQQKFRMLGQIQTLRSFFSTMVETNFETDLITGDKIYSVIYMEIDNLYKCKIDQKFLINMLDLKNKKRENSRYILYLEGAKKLLHNICHNELLKINPQQLNIPNSFQDASNEMKTKLSNQQNNVHLEIVKLYHHCKISLLNYFTSLGKLKALYKIVQVNKKSKDEIKNMFTEHIKKLQLRLEDIDIQITSNMQTSQAKRRIKVQYYEALGKMSVIKCGAKGISFDHIQDYWALHVCQQRTYESTWLQFNIKAEQEERAHNYGVEQMKENENKEEGGKRGTISPKMSDRNIGSQNFSQRSSKTQSKIPRSQFRSQYNKKLFKKLTLKETGDIYNLQTMKQIDKLFNVGNSEVNDEYEGINHAQFIDELQETLERISSYQQTYGSFTSNDSTDKQRNQQNNNAEYISNTVKAILTRVYNNTGSLVQLNSLMKFFESDQNKKLTMGLDHQNAPKKSEIKAFSELVKDNDKFENFIFEYFPLCKDMKDQMVPQDEEDLALNQMMETVSNSFKNIYQDDQRKILYKQKQDALDQCTVYIHRLMKFEQDEFEDDFQRHRDSVFIPGIEVIFQLNKKGLINGFNLQYLSMPVEHSMQFNYWSYQVIKLHLKDQMKSKIMFDISLVAQMNDLNVFQLAGLSGALVDQSKMFGSGETGELINITQGMSNMQNDSSPGAHSDGDFGQTSTQKHGSGKKSIYNDMFNLLTCADSFDRKGKQSMFHIMIQQLEYKILAYSNKVEVLRESGNQIHAFNNQMAKLNMFYSNQLLSLCDEAVLQDNYEAYEVALNNFNKVNNSTKNLDNIFTGSLKYLTCLRDALIKELTTNEQEGNEPPKVLTDFILKIKDQISFVQLGLRNKSKAMVEALSKEAADQRPASVVANKNKKATTSKAAASKGSSAPQSPKSNSSNQQAKATRDQFEQDLKEAENKIIQQILSIQTFSEIIIIARAHEKDPAEFRVEIDRRLIFINSKLSKITQMYKYLNTVCNLIDIQANNLEQQQAVDQYRRGAKIINAVMSGNIVDQIEVYEQSATPTKNAAIRDDPQLLGESSSKELIRPSSDTKNHKSELTSNQKCLNYLTNFLRVICLQDDLISSQFIIKKSSLFFMGQHAMLQHILNKDELEQRYCMKHSLEKLLNIYQIQQTPVGKYLESYQKQTEYVRKELFQNIIVNETHILKNQFVDILSLSAQQVVKASINKIDEVFSEAQQSLQDEEKTEFSNAQTKLRRNLDSNFRTYKEYLDGQSNKNLATHFQNSQKQQSIKMSQMITSINTLVHIYYLKQMQQQEDYLWSIEQVQKATTPPVDTQPTDRGTKQ